jgi:hypothetical protein
MPAFHMDPRPRVPAPAWDGGAVTVGGAGG